MELDSLRIWIDVNETVRANRVVDREAISFESALSENSRRTAKDLARYEEMYGLNPEDSTPYTHVIDASGLTKEEVIASTLKILEEVQ